MNGSEEGVRKKLTSVTSLDGVLSPDQFVEALESLLDRIPDMSDEEIKAVVFDQWDVGDNTTILVGSEEDSSERLAYRLALEYQVHQLGNGIYYRPSDEINLTDTRIVNAHTGVSLRFYHMPTAFKVLFNDSDAEKYGLPDIAGHTATIMMGSPVLSNCMKVCSRDPRYWGDDWKSNTTGDNWKRSAYVMTKEKLALWKFLAESNVRAISENLIVGLYDPKHEGLLESSKNLVYKGLGEL